MSNTVPAKARLIPLDENFDQEVKADNALTVQFNPESLKVTYQNQVVQNTGSGDQRGPQATQHVGAGTTKLSVQLWFDVNAPLPEGEPAVDDVRKLTQKVAWFITPGRVEGSDPPKYLPPAVRFRWGSFQFDGVVDSLDETLELFSPEGKPLRASMSLSLSQQKIQEFQFQQTGPGSSFAGSGAGTRPVSQAPAGASIFDLSVSASVGAGLQGNWQAVAAANGIENPRLLAPGQVVDLRAGITTK
jgi:hypothetical protein